MKYQVNDNGGYNDLKQTTGGEMCCVAAASVEIVSFVADTSSNDFDAWAYLRPRRGTLD